MGKAVFQPPQPPIYRDDPDYAETASMASAVLLDDVDAFPDEELPPSYEATPCQDALGSDITITDFATDGCVPTNWFQ
jgi:hypothetical protein